MATVAALLPWPAGAASIEARRGAVAAEHRLASEAGVEILRAGGNAVDAAVAAALATGVVNPSSSGLGGGGFLVGWDAKRARGFVIDFREVAPGRAHRDMYLRADGSLDPGASRSGPAAVGVPGEARGLDLALREHGRLGLAAAAAPAIRLARDGFVIEDHLAAMIEADRERLAADPGLARVFLHEDGAPRRAGESLHRPSLADTLQRLASVGVDDFYEGEIARDIVAAVAGATLALDASDLASYRPVRREPLEVRYRGHTILAMPPPSSGGGVVGAALAVLAGYDLTSLGRDTTSYAHLLGDTLKATFADRAVFYGDPAFTPVPLARLLGPAHAASIRAKLRASRAVPSAQFAAPGEPARGGGTTHISVVDGDGNAAALTTSINTGFGAALSVPGRDILLNNTMDDFSAQPGKPNAFGLVGAEANAIAPGKRPLSSMSPMVALRAGRVRLVAGGSGGPLIITSTLHTLLGVVDFGMSVDEAVTAPRIHHQWMPDMLFVEEGVGAATEASLRRLGHRTAPLTARASVTAVEVVGRGPSRRLRATSDPRKGGVPAGW